MTDTIKEDLLRGAKQISEYSGEPVRRVFYLADNGLIPAFKMGNIWCMRKSSYRTHLEKLEASASGRGPH